MTDSVSVFPPGYRLTDSATGAPLSGAVISFFDSGTTTPKTVYADQDLSTSLGTSVVTDALGLPTSDGTSPTLIYVGPQDYKIVIKTSGGVTIATYDDVQGAVETIDLQGLSVSALRPVEVKSLDYAVVADDQNKALMGNCSGGDVVFTLPSAVLVGAGWLVTIQHAGTANQVIIETVSLQLIRSGGTSYASALALASNGEEVTLISDGGDWRVAGHIGPHLKMGQGVLTVADRLAAAPGSPPEPGTLYLATGDATWGATSVTTGQVVQHTAGGAYVAFTPPTDCGWLAFVQDEDELYRFTGSAWAQLITAAASQSEMEAASSLAKAVTPGMVRHNPGVAKFWADVTNSGSPTVVASHNVTSLTDTSEGLITINIDVDFSSANWACLATIDSTSSSLAWSCTTESKAAGSVRVRTRRADNGNSSDMNFCVAGFGDQA